MEGRDQTDDDRSGQRSPMEVIRDVLLREWDPIGISDVIEAQDEYDNYVGPVYSILERGGTEESLFEYLWWVETQHMGLIGQREQTEHIAARLIALRNDII
jgi:hypothetical protein